MSLAAQAFRQALQSSNDFARTIDLPEFPLEVFLLLQDWQRQRFRETYADFIHNSTSRAACEFFLEELYGGLGFRERDENVNQVAPLMCRMLPDRALHALSEALQLQVISLNLDRCLADRWVEGQFKTINAAVYGEVYRTCGRQLERKQQIELIRKLGHELEALTQMPMLLGLIKAVRVPARAAGYGRLQHFLERGLSSFRQLHDPHQFVETIYERELALMGQWLHQVPEYDGL
jgi:hypothetical protein